MKRVAIIFANCKGNLGDFAILNAMIEHVLAHTPETSIDVYPDPTIQFSEAYYSSFAAQIPPKVKLKFHDTEVRTRKLNKSIEKLSKKIGLSRAIGMNLIRKHARMLHPKLHNFEKYDSVLVAGGGLWGANEITKFGLIKALREKGIPVYCYPFTAAWPMWEKNSTQTIENIFSNLSHAPFVRESLTQQRFSDIGVATELVPDIAFFLKPTIENIVQNENHDKKRVLISITPRRQRIAEKAHSNTVDHSLCELIHQLEGSNIQPELITTCEIEDNSLYSEIAHAQSIPYHSPDTWQELCAHVKASSCMITNRLHGAILGMLCKVPVFLVTDSDKVKGVASDYPELLAYNSVQHILATSVCDVMAERGDVKSRQDAIVGGAYNKLKDVKVL